MATSQVQNIDELIKAAQLHHEQYMRTLASLQDVLPSRRRERSDSRATGTEPFTPPLRALSGPSLITDGQLPLLRRARRSTLDTQDRPNFTQEPRQLSTSVTPNVNEGVFVHDEDLNFIPLLDLPGSTNRIIEGLPGAAHIALNHESFTDERLFHHLKDPSTNFPDELKTLLDDVLKRRDEIDMAVPFRDFAAYERGDYHVTSTFEVYEVGRNAVATKLSADMHVDDNFKYTGDAPFEGLGSIVDAPTVWDTIKEVNTDNQSVGRITIVQEPTPLMLAALHLTMSQHFDMPELLSHLLSDNLNRGRSHAFMNRAFERMPSSSPSPYPGSPNIRPVDAPFPPLQLSTGHLRQRSFFFVFKYYTVVGEGLKPAPWQRYDERPVDKRLGDHIDIAECSSVLALSLGGVPKDKPLRMRSRKGASREGLLFDTFGPWQLLSIQSFPDEEHSVRNEDYLDKSFVNGPYAFLDLLISEYRDAGQRNQILHERITKLITPPPEFMFDPRLRDKLLFEDKHFTYIRRYFWAYNTLAVVNNGIKSMITAYFNNFTDDFWAGSHSRLWPHEAPDSPDGIAYRDHMAVLRKELEKVVKDLSDVFNRNERTRKEIENLRDQLFSGSSIKESRRAIEQGDNIRILTMISMIFLPLTFVTSVFGITEFTIPATNWRFPVVMVMVCVPFMVLIFLLQTRTFTKLIDKIIAGAIWTIQIPSRIYKKINEPPDPQVTATRHPKRRRKRRLAVDADETREEGSWWKLRTRWPLGTKKTTVSDDVDLGKMEGV